VTERLAVHPRRASYTKELGHLASLLREIAPDELPPGEKVARVVAFYAPMLRHLHPEDFPKREKDLEHFVTIAGRYRSLASLLSDMALEPPSDSVGDVLAADVEEGLLTLSTIHSAKGLEWKASSSSGWSTAGSRRTTTCTTARRRKRSGGSCTSP